MNISNIEHRMLPKANGGLADFLAVLTVDETGLFAVYIGMADLPAYSEPTYVEYTKERYRQAHKIAHFGTKQNYRQACEYFRGLQEEEYRA